MSQRLAILSNNLDDASAVVDALRSKGHSDEDIYVITKQDIILEDLPEAEPRQYSVLLPTLKKEAGVGGAIAAFAAGAAALGAWTTSLIGIRLPNSNVEDSESESLASKLKDLRGVNITNVTPVEAA